MKRSVGLLSNTVRLGFAAAFSKLLSFLLLPLYTAYLSPADFGIAEILVSTAVLLIPLTSLCAPEACFRFVAGGENRRATVTAGVLLLFTGGALLLLLLPLACRAYPVLSPYRLYLFFYVIAAVLHSFLSHLLRARGAYGAYALQQMLCAALTALLQLLFLKGLQRGIAGYLSAIILADAITALLLLFCLLPRRGVLALRLSGDSLGNLLRYALPLIPASVLWWVNSAADRYFLLYYHGTVQTGIYIAAGRLPALLGFLVGVFMEAWQYTALQRQEKARAAAFSFAYRMLLPLLTAAVAALLLVTAPLVGLLLSPQYGSARLLVPILAVAALFSGLSVFLNSIYVLFLRSRSSLLTALFGAAVNILLNFLLIPHFGGTGAAVSTLLSGASVFLLRAVHTGRLLPFKRYIFQLLCAVSLLMLAAYFVMIDRVFLAIPPCIFSVLIFQREIAQGLVFLQIKLQGVKKIWKSHLKNDKKAETDIDNRT